MESNITQTLEKIAEVIEKTSQPGLVEYLAIVISAISVVVSGIAILFAIRVADKQNKISLFEKRYEIYKQCVKYYALAIQVGVAKNRAEIQRAWLDIDRSIWNESMIDNTKKIFSKTEEARFKMSQARYLFNEEIGRNVDDFMTLLIEVVYLSLFDNKKSEMKKYQEKLMEYTDKKESILLLMEMEGYLHLERLGDKHALHRS